MSEKTAPWVHYGGPEDVDLDAEQGDRWPIERINDWYDREPWILGANFFPSTAVNSIEMWQAPTFDPDTIRRELGWARDLGFNSVRVFVNHVVWEDDRDGLLARFDDFLSIAAPLGIRTVPVLFDDCVNSDVVPQAGPQPDMIPGVFVSAWVSSLPRGGATEYSAEWETSARPYVQDLVSAFGADDRVLLWDLYNEPMDASRPLVEHVFRWAREREPSQPLTSVWVGGRYSDLMNAHCYSPLEVGMTLTLPRGGEISWPSTKATIEGLRRSGRPVILTEWLARHMGSRIETHLPYLCEEKVACWNWGMVAGRMQTFLPYPFLTTEAYRPPPAPPSWMHDLLHPDGTPYSDLEADTLRYYAASRRDR